MQAAPQRRAKPRIELLSTMQPMTHTAIAAFYVLFLGRPGKLMAFSSKLTIHVYLRLVQHFWGLTLKSLKFRSLRTLLLSFSTRHVPGQACVDRERETTIRVGTCTHALEFKQTCYFGRVAVKFTAGRSPAVRVNLIPSASALPV